MYKNIQSYVTLNQQLSDNFVCKIGGQAGRKCHLYFLLYIWMILKENCLNVTVII